MANSTVPVPASVSTFTSKSDGSFLKATAFALLTLTLFTVAIGGLYARQDVRDGTVSANP